MTPKNWTLEVNGHEGEGSKMTPKNRTSFFYVLKVNLHVTSKAQVFGRKSGNLSTGHV
jgi:hypothetical protein